MQTLTALLNKHNLGGAAALTSDAFILAVGRALDRGLMLVLFVLMGRILGVAEYGQFSYAFALASILGVISELGLSLLINREVARTPAVMNRYVDNGASLRVVFGALTLLLTCLVLWLLQTPLATILMVFFLLLSMVIESFQGLLLAVFRAQRRMTYQTIVIVATRIVIVTLGILLLFRSSSGVLVAAAFPAGSIAGSLLALYYYQRHFSLLRPALDYAFCLRFVRDSLPFAVAIIFGMIHFRVDTVILQAYRGDVEVGLYNAAYQIVVGAAIVATAFMNALFPVMARLYVTSIERLRTVFWASLAVMVGMGLSVALIGTAFAEPILVLLYGQEYAGATLAMQLLSWGVCFSFMNNMTGNTLNAINLQVPNMWTIGIGALVNVVLNIVLISIWGNTGAAVTTMSTELLVFLIGFVQILRFFRNQRQSPQ